MKKEHKSWGFFTMILIFFCLAFYFLLRQGSSIDAELNHSAANNAENPFELFKSLTHLNIIEPTAILLLQIIAILIVSRIFSTLFARIKQPTVVGEIIAGIVLGPTILGYFFPSIYNFVFSPDSLHNLYIVSQLGLILYMFTIGMDLNMSELKDQFKNTFVISITSIAIPFILGMTVAFFVFQEYVTGNITFISFALFIGISMSITAFPVLARIVQEKGLSKTHLGTISIGSAAIDDVTAWILLVAVIAIAQTGSFASSIYTLILTLIYIALMILLVRPMVKRIATVYQKEELMNKSIFGFFILILIISAYSTQVLGIHALFGAFLAGVIMPPLPKFRRLMVDKIEDLSVSLLLPLFFVYTGLKTEIGLVNTPQLWMLCFLFIFVAIVGKFGGGTLAARATGESWRDSLSLGVLMNTRGLMELVVLNIGLEMGILPPVIFAMLVLMALFTTFMTTPMLHFFEKVFPDKQAKAELLRQQASGVFKALVSVGNPESGKNLLRVAKSTLNGTRNLLEVEVLHITAGTDLHPIYSEQFSKENFATIMAEAEALKIPITTEYRVADIIEYDIVSKANTENFDFLLVGGGVSTTQKAILKDILNFRRFTFLNTIFNKLTNDAAIFYPGTLIRDKSRYFIENSNCSVGVFVNRDFKSITNTLIVLDTESDIFLLRFARRMMRTNQDVNIEILGVEKMNGQAVEITETINELSKEFGNRVKHSKSLKMSNCHPEKFSFMMISYPTWEYFVMKDIKTLKNIPSTLIINKKPSRFSIQAITPNNQDEDYLH